MMQYRAPKRHCIFRLAGRWRTVERATPEEREAMATTTDKAAERLCEEAEIIQLTLRCRIPGLRPKDAQDAEVALRQKEMEAVSEPLRKVVRQHLHAQVEEREYRAAKAFYEPGRAGVGDDSGSACLGPEGWGLFR